VLWTWHVPAIHAQAGPVTIEGQVVNATPDGGSVEGTVVVLHREAPSVHDHVETLVDSDGQFGFEAIEVDDQATYGVSVTYQGALFGVDLDLTAGDPAPVTLTVYDAMQGDEVLSVSSASLLFAQTDVPSQRVVVLEIVKIVNRSDRAYAPGPEPMDLLRFGLPPGAQGLSVDTQLAGADFIQVDRGFALVATVPPGEYEVLFRYSFPYSGTEATVIKSFRYGAEHLRVLAPEGLMQLSSPDLDGPETVDIGGRRYGLLQATGLPRGASVSLELTGLTVSTLADRIGDRIGGTRFEYVAPIGLGVFMAMLIAYALVSRLRRRGGADDPVG
jgi:hypothetical protein